MSGTLQFTRTYADYGPAIRDFEMDPEVSAVLARIMCDLHYPYDAFIGTKMSSIWLRDGEPAHAEEAGLDLLFMVNGYDYIEIILRDKDGSVVQGGYLMGGKKVVITDEIEAGYRVIVVTHEDHSETRHAFVPGVGYEPANATGMSSLAAHKRKKMNSGR